MSEEGKFEELRMHVSGMREKGDVLRMCQLSFIEQTVTRLLLPPGSRKNIRPQFQGVRQGVETLEVIRAQVHRRTS